MYTVRFKDTVTGEEAEKVYEYEWEDGSDYWWSEGNFSCDCNRYLEFLRAKGQDPALDEAVCNSGDNRYEVVSITCPDGQVVYRDNEA